LTSALTMTHDFNPFVFPASQQYFYKWRALKIKDRQSTV
jgi:hypothetical protein